MGREPMLTIGFGRNSVSSRRRVPRPPQRITTLILSDIVKLLFIEQNALFRLFVLLRTVFIDEAM
jgi:hypothetical protein